MEDLIKKRAIVKSGGKIDPNQVSEEVFLFNPDGTAFTGEPIAEGDVPAPPDTGIKHLVSTDKVMSWEDIEEELPSAPGSGLFTLVSDEDSVEWQPFPEELPPIEESGTYTLKTIDGVLTWVADGGGE